MIVAHQHHLYETIRLMTRKISLTDTPNHISLEKEKLFLVLGLDCLNTVTNEGIQIMGNNFSSPLGAAVKLYMVKGKQLRFPFSSFAFRNSIQIDPIGTTEKHVRVHLLELSPYHRKGNQAKIIPDMSDIIENNGSRFQQIGESYYEYFVTENDSISIPHSHVYDNVQLRGYSVQKATNYANHFPLINMVIEAGPNFTRKNFQHSWPHSADLTGTVTNTSPSDLTRVQIGGGKQGGVYLPAKILGKTMEDFHYTPFISSLFDASETIRLTTRTHGTVTTYDAIIGVHLAYFQKLR